MSTLPRPACCGRPMTGVEVSRTGSVLALHTCVGCGRHEWARDGEPLDRDAVLSVMRDRRPDAVAAPVLVARPGVAQPRVTQTRVAQPRVTHTRVAQPRVARRAPVRPEPDTGRRAEIRALLDAFTVHGS